ncbi:MAG: hypothetical protein M1833_000966 [Piccolia ochrophora]|nr:MAG: hypothetical protein M1833_000966 [Piccolia ochrophora]
MPPTTPQVTIAKPPKAASTNGILPITASVTQADGKQGRKQSGGAAKGSGPRLKVVIRRLPPGFTHTELLSTLGEEWSLGRGRVDWLRYKPGKISRDPAKPPIPARAYLHLTNENHLKSFSDRVRQTPFHDSKGTWNLSSLPGPPSVEFSPYGRIPTNKRRNDARQGTIDQDPEFIAFLESLTNPVPNKAVMGDESADAMSKKEKITTTPLVQFLKEKKATKGKETTSPAKASKHSRTEPKDSRTARIVEKKSPSKISKESIQESRRAGKESKPEDTPKEAVRVLNRESTANSKKAKPTQTQSSASSVEASSSKPKAAGAGPSPVPERRRERGNASAAAKILQRDLGLGPGTSRRAVARRETGENGKDVTGAPANKHPTKVTVGEDSKVANQSPDTRPNQAALSDPSAKAAANGTTGRKPSKPASTSSGPPALLKRESSAPQPPSGPASSRANTTTSHKVARSGIQAFLKHANPSQGITEPLLKTALEAFGAVTKVEIDKKKGFAYVDFTDADGLRNAIQAGPVKVAEGSVVVLEMRPKPSSGSTSTRGARGERGGRGGAFPGSRGGSGERGSRGRGRGGGAPPRGGGEGGSTRSPAADEATGGRAVPTGPAAAAQKPT